MKVIIIAIALVISGAAYARVPITTQDGNLYLNNEPCTNGGREATLIETRDNGGGAYGCWVIVGDRIEVLWTTLVGPTGSFLKSNLRRSYPATRDLIEADQR